MTIPDWLHQSIPHLQLLGDGGWVSKFLMISWFMFSLFLSSKIFLSLCVLHASSSIEAFSFITTFKIESESENFVLLYTEFTIYPHLLVSRSFLCPRCWCLANGLPPLFLLEANSSLNRANLLTIECVTSNWWRLGEQKEKDEADHAGD